VRCLKRTATAIGFLSLALLSACGGDTGNTAGSASPDTADQSWEAVQERAAAEGRLTVYTVAPPAQNERLLEAFNVKYPDIQVNLVRGSAELPQRVSAEIQSNSDGADVLISSEPEWFSNHEDGLREIGSASSSAWPADAWMLPDTAPILALVPFGIVTWNTQAVPAGLSDWDDLLSPKLNGRIGAINVFNAVQAGFVDAMIEEKGTAFIEDFAGQNPKFYDSMVPAMQAVASGELYASWQGVLPTVLELQGQGAPIDYALPDPTYVIPYTGAALEKSLRPNAARVFMDFLMSAEGQAALNGAGYAGSPLPDVAGVVDLPESAVVFDYKTYSPDVVADLKKTYFGILGLTG
jgi:iron(III) transport system substrate-binding protein